MLDHAQANRESGAVHPTATRHVVHVFPSFGLGGQQVRCAVIANAFADRLRHTVIALDGDTGCRSRLQPQAACTFPSVRARRSGWPNPAAVLAYRRILSSLRPDFLCTYNWGTAEWACANRWRPLCEHLHFEDGFGVDESPERQRRRRVWFRRLALSGRGTRVVVPSRTLHRIALESWGLDPSRVLYVPNGIDLSRFAAPVRGVRRDAAPVTVGTVGALRPEKNLSRLLEVAAALPAELDVRFVVAGDGPERPRLEARSRELGVETRVSFVGQVDQPERVLRDLDLFILTSDTEQMPYTVLEAMACELPVVATDVGDVRHMLAAENAPFVQPKDAAALAGAVAALCRDPGLRRAVGRANGVRARSEFGLAAMLDTYRGLFGT